jgi:hypothetical protein
MDSWCIVVKITSKSRNSGFRICICSKTMTVTVAVWMQVVPTGLFGSRPWFICTIVLTMCRCILVHLREFWVKQMTLGADLSYRCTVKFICALAPRLPFKKIGVSYPK